MQDDYTPAFRVPATRAQAPDRSSLEGCSTGQGPVMTLMDTQQREARQPSGLPILWSFLDNKETTSKKRVKKRVK